MKKFISLFIVVILIFALVIGQCNDAIEEYDGEIVSQSSYTEEEFDKEDEAVTTAQDTEERNKIDIESEQEETTEKKVVAVDGIDVNGIVLLPSNIPSQLLSRTAYCLSYNKETRQPNWVAWHLTAEHTDGPYGRLGNFHEEDDVPQPRATLQDYRGSGWSRGHMCPAGDNKWDRKAMYESFSLVNVCPQNASLNSGLWNSIEMDCRKWARKFGDIYIVCGPLFLNKDHETIGENLVFVPEAFFKVVLCLNGKPKAFGFIVRNTEGNKKRDLYYNSIDQVERITGMDFFPALPDDIEDEVEAAADIKDWR